MAPRRAPKVVNPSARTTGRSRAAADKYTPPEDAVLSINGPDGRTVKQGNDYNWANVLTESGHPAPPWHTRPWPHAESLQADNELNDSKADELTKQHRTLPLSRHFDCIEPWEGKFENAAKAAAYFGHASTRGFITWMDTECADLIRPYGLRRRDGWPNTTTGRTASRKMFLEMLSSMRTNQRVQTAMGHVEAGVAIAMPQSLFDGNEEDDRDNNTGLALAACYTLLRFTTDGTGNDHTTGGAWFKPAPEGTGNRAYVALRSYIDRRVGHQVLFPTVTPKLAVTPVAFLRIRDAEGIISSEKGARLHANVLARRNLDRMYKDLQRLTAAQLTPHFADLVIVDPPADEEEAVAEAEADDIIADNMGNELALMSEATNLLKHLQAQHRLDGTVPRDPMDMGTLEEVRRVAQAIADGQVPAAAADDNGDRTNSEETSAFLDALNTKAAISGTIQESATVHDAAASEGSTCRGC
ncbi:hypothetical protein CMQ_5386 [Grosmannia clavigera kw1407]|uniref:Uncharacterized protein n=1 Tax=Grosmannia clavigera (strain kw1407 / UAMH 11150) TaxID=655863 RepID=F0XNI9_GROCL|nr:uncharacterized protein CMQ_5386 [Grosmannia clavigera kw1407]EFX00752.1 hypothetical protein CMQ_5386 [Grosmannia clavigera kw1407]